jgi:hypothetical protein
MKFTISTTHPSTQGIMSDTILPPVKDIYLAVKKSEFLATDAL